MVLPGLVLSAREAVLILIIDITSVNCILR